MSAQRRTAPVGVICLCALVVGCSAGPRDFTNENDRLREERVELERKVEALQANINLRLAEIDSLKQQQGKTGAATPAGADAPLFTAVQLDRYTGCIDTNKDGRDDTLRLYVLTLDQQGRFLPVGARATLQAVAIEQGVEPVVIVEQAWDGKAFSEAYRTGFTGTHFTLEAPLPAALPAKWPGDKKVTQLAIKLTVTDLTAGVEKEIQQTVAVDFEADVQREAGGVSR